MCRRGKTRRRRLLRRRRPRPGRRRLSPNMHGLGMAAAAPGQLLVTVRAHQCLQRPDHPLRRPCVSVVCCLPAVRLGRRLPWACPPPGVGGVSALAARPFRGFRITHTLTRFLVCAPPQILTAGPPHRERCGGDASPREHFLSSPRLLRRLLFLRRCFVVDDGSRVSLLREKSVMTPSAGGSRCPPSTRQPSPCCLSAATARIPCSAAHTTGKAGGPEKQNGGGGWIPARASPGCPQKPSSPTKAACGRQGHTTTGVCFSNSHLALPHARGARAEGLGSRATGLDGVAQGNEMRPS